MSAGARWRKGFYAAFMVVLAVVSLFAGAATMEFRTPPYTMARQFFMGVFVINYFLEGAPLHLWKPVRVAGSGVTRYDPEMAYNGLTFFTSAHAQSGFLIDMDGDVVHEWRLKYSEVWDDSAATRDPFEDERINWREVYLYPNGDLLVVFAAPGDTPWGYGLVKIDKDSNVIWKYLQNAHHDVTVDPQGRVFTLTHAIREAAIPGLEFLTPPILDDFVTILSADGEEIESFSVSEAFRDSPYKDMLGTAPVTNNGDYTHANSVDLVDAEFAAASPIAEEGDVLVSLRNIHTIALIDPDRKAVTWAYRGPWHMQHDADLLPDGAMLVFDNLGHYGPGDRSRVVEFDPVTGEILWAYTGTADEPFESDKRANQQRLPNGNTLITESHRARLFEVTRDKQIVWEYVSPFRGGPGGDLVALLGGGLRVRAEALEFPLNGGMAPSP